MDNRDKPATVLVADDDNAVRQFVRTAIEQIGLNVCEASNGSEVLEQFTLRHPDVIVLDVMMPVMDGFAACSKLRGEAAGDGATPPSFPLRGRRPTGRTRGSRARNAA